MPEKPKVIVRGVVEVPVSILTKAELAHIEKTLLVHNKRDAAKSVKAYRFSRDLTTIELPKYYVVKHLLDRVRPYLVNTELTEKPKKWTFAGQLRPHQLAPKSGCVSTPQLAELVRKKKGVFASAPCGSGKTISAIYVIAALGGSSLVIVPNQTLLKQWCAQLKRFLPGARVTKYCGSAKKDLTGDVVVASLQLLAADRIDRKFSLLILDEAHMAATNVFSRAMFNVNFKHSLALTATGDRFDRMDPLFRWPLAHTTVTLDTDQLPVTVRYVPFTYRDKAMQDALNAVDPIRIDHSLALYAPRNTKLIELLLDAVARKRRIIVISKSIVQLRLLWTVFTSVRPDIKTAVYTGDPSIGGKRVKETGRSAAEVLQDERYLNDPDAVVFTTVGKAGVGYDDPNKDYLLMALPMLDPRQVIGRVQRALPGKNPPEVVVLVDDLTSPKDRMLAAYFMALLPLKEKCIVHNQCPWYRGKIGGQSGRQTETINSAIYRWQVTQLTGNRSNPSV